MILHGPITRSATVTLCEFSTFHTTQLRRKKGCAVPELRDCDSLHVAIAQSSRSFLILPRDIANLPEGSRRGKSRLTIKTPFRTNSKPLYARDHV